MTLATDIQTGRNNHAGLHNEERTSINALAAQFAATLGSTSVLMPDASASVNVTNIRNLIEAARFGENGATIQLGPGTFNLNDTIEFHNLYGLRFVGCGGASILRWIGNDASKPVLKLSHCQRCYLADFQINIANVAYAGIQQLRDNVEPRTVTPMRNQYERIDVFCNNAALTGIYVGGTGIIDANNDFALFVNCKVQDYAREGWFLEGSQSYGNEMYHCYCRGGVGAQYGVFAEVQNGHFNWYGGFIGQNTKADFYIGRSTQPYIIEGVNSEGSARLLEQPLASYKQIVLRNIRWAGNALHADKKAIITNGRLFLFIEHCMIGYASGNSPVTFEFKNSFVGSDTGSIVMIGNRIYSTATDVFPVDNPSFMTGNVKITDESALTTVALTQ